MTYLFLTRRLEVVCAFGTEHPVLKMKKDQSFVVKVVERKTNSGGLAVQKS